LWYYQYTYNYNYVFILIMFFVLKTSYILITSINHRTHKFQNINETLNMHHYCLLEQFYYSINCITIYLYKTVINPHVHIMCDSNWENYKFAINYYMEKQVGRYYCLPKKIKWFQLIISKSKVKWEYLTLVYIIYYSKQDYWYERRSQNIARGQCLFHIWPQFVIIFT